jgi:hypothetical protein
MDELIASVLEDLVGGQNEFFGTTIARLRPATRDAQLTRFFNNQLVLMELINRVHNNYVRREAASALITLGLATPATFTDPVTVAPTTAQIQTAIESVPAPVDSHCAICQETMEGRITRIRHCGHMYHRSCFSQWFSMSVRCPVCRYDIREAGQAAETQLGGE